LGQLHGGNPRARCCVGVTHNGDKIRRGTINGKGKNQID